MKNDTMKNDCMKNDWENKFYEFCKNNKMNLFSATGEPLAQKLAVMETKNCVVAAGAGSGKTTVLSFRFLRMVASGTSPERILTITFTKKATAEMKGRIYELLQKGHEANLVTAQDMKKFSEVTISTVDSFCSEIVRRDAVHQGVPADFRIQDKDDFEEMSNVLVDALLEENKDKEIVKQLHSYLKVDDIEKIFRDVAYNFLNIARPFSADEVFNRSKETLLKTLPEAMEPFEEKLASGKKLNKEESKLYNLFSNGQDDCSLANLEDFYKLVQTYEKRLFDAKRAAGVLSFGDVMQLAIKILKENEAIRDFYKKKFDNIMIDEFQDNNDDYRKLLYLLSENLDSHICDEEGIPVKENLCPNKIFLVGDEKQSIYKFRGADVTVFKRLCNELCPQPIELSRNWRSEPAIINFCNDTFPKIMSQEELQTEDGRPSFEARYLALATRPETPGLTSRLALLHPDMDLKKETSSAQTDTSEEDQEEFLDSEAEAKVVASFIKAICTSTDSQFGSFLVPDDTQKDELGNPILRLPRYNEIGLLFKVGSHQANFEKALTEQGIPYTVTEARSLMKGNLVNDFYNALQYCVFPYDEISYASYLKSPFCSLKDDELEQILAYKRAKQKEVLDETLDEALTEALKAKMNLADEALAKLKEIVAYGSICKVLDFLWYDLGYRDYMLSHELNRPFLDDFNNLYTIAVGYDNDGQSMVAFLDYLRPLLNSTDKIEMDAVFKEQIDGVQIMTIHKSKGLAFKIVIVADMQSGARDPAGTKPENVVQGNQLFLRYVVDEEERTIRNPMYELEKTERNEKENAEAKRILYVAETRAKHHLIFSGVIKKKLKKPKDPTKKNPNPAPEISVTPKFVHEAGKRTSLLTYLLESISADSEDDNWAFKGNGYRFEDFCIKPTSVVDFSENKTKEEIKKEVKKVFDTAKILTLSKSISRVSVTHSGEEQQENPAGTTEGALEGSFEKTMSSKPHVWRKFLPKLDCDDIIREKGLITEFGTLTHKILEDTLSGHSEQIPSDSEEIFYKKELAAEQKELIFSCANALANSFLQSRLYEQIKDLNLQPEKKFLLFNGEAYVDGVIDLLALGEQEAYILDYKTDSSMSVEDHKNQLTQYVNALKSIYPEKTIHAYVCYLRQQDNNVKIV